MRRSLILTLALLFGGTLAPSYCALDPSYLTDLTDDQQGDRQIEKEFRIAAGHKLDFDLKTGGSIDITGWDGELVSVRVHLDGRDWQDCQITFNESASGLQILSDYTSGKRSHATDLKFEVKVPKRFNLGFDTMGGSIKISDIEGQIKGKTMGGGYTLKNLKGELDLLTMGGGITLTNSDVNGEVKTMGGEVLIKDVIGNVKGSSMGGNVIYQNVTNRRGETTGDEVRISTMGGEIKVEDAPAGADVMTMGGDINIGTVGDHVRAKTMGGDINIEAVDGWVQATTMAGDVAVRMVGNPDQGRRDVTITSYSGDVTLTVPAGLSMEFDIELAETKNSDRSYRIISDFEVQQRESDRWDQDNGTPRKYIYGTGSVAGGRNKIKIRTINGNVYLKRGNI
ncbi:MAG TPA: hypothetical protein VD966_06190 [Pyrinomonadaceae bacterium]|nr:hypothetical protein [Pyrinomonadaceae bacterium]